MTVRTTAPTVSTAFDPSGLVERVHRVRRPLLLVRDPSGRHGAVDGEAATELEVIGRLPALYPEWLGDRSFGVAHGVRFPYVVGAMANGIASVELVVAAARAGLVGFFGAAGLAPARVARSIREIRSALDDAASGWGANLIHSPNEPDLEAAVTDLYLEAGVRRVSASAFMSLTANLVRYACTGLDRDREGRIVRRNHVFAKISRPEMARLFMSPAPAALLDRLRDRGQLTELEARLAAEVPIAEDITVEADSGGHTDNRPLTALLPTVRRLRDELAARHGYARPIRVGAAGGLGAPAALAAAFAAGADYVLTGSVNQAAVEAGLDRSGKALLAEADLADVIMAPAGDMFEMGIKLQVLKRGTLFPGRAQRLWELYRAHDGLDSIPAAERDRLERDILRMPVAEVWEETRAYFAERDPAQIERAERDEKHRMALVFRWYLGKSSRWAIDGETGRTADYQIWCGPAMGAFNAWVAGSFLEPLENRTAAQIAWNLLEGAAVITRAQQLRSLGVAVPAAAFEFRPRPLQ